MSKTKSVWESRFYILKHSLKMQIGFVCQNLAAESIDANGEEINTKEHWKTVGKHAELEDLIRQAEYIETQMYF